MRPQHTAGTNYFLVGGGEIIIRLVCAECNHTIAAVIRCSIMQHHGRCFFVNWINLLRLSFRNERQASRPILGILVSKCSFNNNYVIFQDNSWFLYLIFCAIFIIERSVLLWYEDTDSSWCVSPKHTWSLQWNTHIINLQI